MENKSIRSATTRGGVDFDDLAAEKVSPNYAFNLYGEIDNELSDMRTALNALSKWLDITIQYIECQSGKRISKFYIGKTYMHGHKGRKFNKQEPTTWRKVGISSRWGIHRNKEYGKSGMVVLTVITRDRVPKGAVKAFNNQQHYALALEQQLIMHYAFAQGDERLANETINPGKMKADEAGGSEVTGAIGYPIYMAYVLEEDTRLPEPDDGVPQEMEADDDPSETIRLTGDDNDEDHPPSPRCMDLEEDTRSQVSKEAAPQEIATNDVPSDVIDLKQELPYKRSLDPKISTGRANVFD